MYDVRGVVMRTRSGNDSRSGVVCFSPNLATRCGLSLDDVKIEYNKGYAPLAALLRFSSKAMFTTAIRQANQNRLHRIDEISRETWDLKKSFDGKAVLLQGVPRNALADDIERFLCGTNFEPPPFETFLRAGVPEPIRMMLVKFHTKTDAMNAFITKNRSFCLNSQVSMRVLQ
ncbi:Ribosomal protein S24e family protein [Zea mays]|uniref:Ribosomal protein S24e family protein n=1 Tax=Zea mays TaxID=4577 RepID=A0A1D6PDA2_MAIZE|nr:Ribosomal protein S24e family protein [Zea mays]